MRTTTIRTPLHSSDSVQMAPRAPGGILGAAQSVLIVIGCVALGAVLLLANVIAFPVRLIRRLLHQ